MSSVGSFLLPGIRLNPGQSLTSPSGRYELTMQGDGNLVAVDHGNSDTAYWASDTPGHPNSWFVVQGDGNELVLAPPAGAVMWASYTQGNTPGFFVLQDDGNGVLYAPDARTPIWNIAQDNANRSNSGLLVTKLEGVATNVAGPAIDAVQSVGDWIAQNPEIVAAIDTGLANLPIVGPALAGYAAVAEETLVQTASLIAAAKAAEAQGAAIAGDLQSILNAAQNLPAEAQQGFAQGIALALSNTVSPGQIANLYAQLDQAAQQGFSAAFNAAGKPLPSAPAGLNTKVSTGQRIGVIATSPKTGLNAKAPPVLTKVVVPQPAPVPTTIQALLHAAALGDEAAATSLGPAVLAHYGVAAPAPKPAPVAAAPKPVQPVVKQGTSSGGGGAIALLAGGALLLAMRLGR